MGISTEIDVRVYNANGKRKYFPQQWISEVEFEIGERGGCLTGTMQVVAPWEQLQLAGTEYVDIRLWGSSQVIYRGWIRQPQNELATPERASITMFGMMCILNGYQVRRDYTFAAASIDQVFLAMAQDIVTRSGRLSSVVLDTTGVSGLGITVDVFQSSGKNVSDAMNALCDMAPGQLNWGCDVDSSGNNRLYLRPRPIDPNSVGRAITPPSGQPTYKVTVGGNVTGLVVPPDVNQVVNRIIVTGGTIQPPNNPNLANNPSFETINQPGETTSNLLENPSFETANGVAPTLPVFWQVTGSTNPSLAQGNGRTGQNALDMPPGSTVSQVISIGAGVVLNQSCWMNIPPSETAVFEMVLTAYDSSGSVISSLSSGTLSFAAGTVGAFVWQHYSQNWTTPAGTVTVKVEYDADSSSGAGMNLDDCSAWTSQPTSQGWALGIASGGYVSSIDWCHSVQDVPNSPMPFEPGVVMLKIEAVITGGSGSFVELTSTVDARPSINSFETYTGAFHVAADTGGSALDAYTCIRVWGGDTLQITVGPGFPAGTGSAVPQSIPADGAWHQVPYQFTVSATSTSVDLVLRMTKSGTYYVDAAQLVQGTLGGAFGQTLYTLDGTYRGMRDVTSFGAGVLGTAVAASITDYYEREAQIDNENVIDEATMDAFAEGYLQAHGVPAIQARLTIDGATQPIGLDGLIKILNLPDAPPPLPASKVRYQIGASVRMDIDLNDERTDEALLLRRIQNSGIGGVPWP